MDRKSYMKCHLEPLYLTLSDLERSIQVTGFQWPVSPNLFKITTELLLMMDRKSYYDISFGAIVFDLEWAWHLVYSGDNCYVTIAALIVISVQLLSTQLGARTSTMSCLGDNLPMVSFASFWILKMAFCACCAMCSVVAFKRSFEGWAQGYAEVFIWFTCFKLFPDKSEALPHIFFV